VLVVHRHEHERGAVDGNLERLQFAISQVVWMHRNKAVNERVRIPSPVLYSGAADILDNPDITRVIRVDAFVTAAAEAAIKCA
jgi:hypothetical protein